MRLHTPYMLVAARALARVLRTLALPLALSVAGSAAAQPADPDVGPLRFEPCPGAPALDCGSLTVPVTYGHRDRTVDLAVARARATDPARRLGVLFVHPGGHAAGVDFLMAGQGAPIFEQMRARFDLVSLDPRGTGRSRALHCGFDLPAPPADDDDASLIPYLDETSRLVAKQCLDEDPEFVLSITGPNFARDIERLRRALGEPQLNFVMASNSGPVAAAYAALFPKRVRAMVIDAPVAAEHRDYWIERRIEQGDSYERTLQRIDQICRRTPACPLATLGVVSTFDVVRARLNAQPIVLPSGEPFTGETFADTLFVLMPVESLWLPMVNALALAREGDLGPFIGIAASGGDAADDDGIFARLCNDYGTRRDAADYLPVAEAAGGVHPRFFDRDQLLGDASFCAAWPKGEPPPIRNVRLDVPALTLHAEFDSDAPFAWGQRLAHAMGDDRHIVRYQGGGHGVVGRQQPCIRETVEDYLFDLKLPKEGLACPAEVTPGAEGFTARSLERPSRSFAISSEVPLRLPTRRR